jgi:hypothetical protein
VIPIIYLISAEAEVLEAIAYLEDRAPGLGRRLFGEIQRAERFITQFPNGSAK